VISPEIGTPGSCLDVAQFQKYQLYQKVNIMAYALPLRDVENGRGLVENRHPNDETEKEKEVPKCMKHVG
jgi:hypothetical protein